MKAQYIYLKNNINKFMNNDYIIEIYVIIIALITMIGWRFSTIFGLTAIVSVSLIMILLTGTLNYLIPNVIFAIFNINTGFSSDTFPAYMIILFGIFILVLIIFNALNGIYLKKYKSFIGLFGLGIAMIIPLLWFKHDNGHIMFKYLYFSGIIYALILYIC